MMVLRSHQGLSHILRVHRPIELNRFACHETGLKTMLEFYEGLGYLTEDILSPPAFRKLTDFRNMTS